MGGMNMSQVEKPIPNIEIRKKFEIQISKIPTVYFGDFLKNRNSIEFVILANAGIQLFKVLDPGFRRGDVSRDFLGDHHFVD